MHLVGAGPGDPDLLTLRARELLERADLVLYDNLSSPEVLMLARPGAERRYVGKKRAHHALPQAAINEMMVAAASDGKAVVRLKGGDPYVFGRGGEEAAALAASGIPFEVVPGVSSALGASAYAGIPLTHRDCAHAVTMLTGHDVGQVDWESLAGRQTLVVFMGLMSLPEIARRLVAAGRRADTPAAALRWATRGDQEVVTGTLASLPDRIRERGLKPPALVIIGEVVDLREKLDWFAGLPLRGRSVVVTRATAQAEGLCRRLRRLGAQVIRLPLIEFTDPSSWRPADRAIQWLRSYDWLVFTSVNGVDRFVKRLDASPRDLRDLPARICAIGPATAARIERLHVRVDLVPPEFVAESLADSFRGVRLNQRRVLIPRAESARTVLPDSLTAMGAVVEVVPVYRTVLPESSRRKAAALWRDATAPDWVTVASSSTARHLASVVPADRLRRTRIASIGPVTSSTVKEAGLEVAAQAVPYTVPGLVRALCLAASPRRAGTRYTESRSLDALPPSG